MQITKIILLWIVTDLQEGYSNETKCNVQSTIVNCCNLALTTIPRHLPVNATYLDLFKNSIRIVPGFTFQTLRYLTHLHLERNGIQVIEKNAFHGLHRLRSLHLSFNSIKLFPAGTFDRLNGLQELSIDNNKLQYLQDNEITKILNMLKIMSLRKFSFDIYPNFKFPSQWGTLSELTDLGIFARSAKVQFNNAMFAHVNLLKIMSLSIDVVPFISEDFFEHFPKLDSITLSIGTDLPKNPIDQVFKSFGVFRGRNLTSIEINTGRFDNGFTLNYKRMKYLWSICLKRLTLNNLYIKDILIYAMQEFSIKSTCLEYLEFSENTIFDRGASVIAVMNNLKNLKVLKITRNWRNSKSKRSQQSSLFSFVLPKTLEELYVEHNMGGDMSDVEVINGFNLRVLSLKDNEMWSCIGTFTGITNVEYFDMSGWRCEKLSINLLYGFPNLKTLKASGSHLGKGFVNLAGAGSFLSKNLRLKDINLSFNKINSIPDGLLLRRFEQLSSVNMSYNNLKIFPKFHASIKTLKIIDLTFNSITRFNDEDIEHIESLENQTDSVWVKQFHDKVNSMGFELCLHDKDFIAGESIAVNVLNAIDSSRKVIFIITHEFLKSSWGSYEMEMTRMHAFQKGREDMVIVVVKDDIKITDMPEVMKNMWIKITCIQWPNDDNLPYNTEEIFYEKMKMSLQRREDTTLLYSRNSVI
ncbi:unnamed protein product [Mytilus edulis]|uniref:TIR domain-containing protein n=1 Tax=Mytilus edulis TaxID=6550 RepID=A0A8S3VGN4_MYTED|nr:unnamed protein product [Mytilus edulis]